MYFSDDELIAYLLGDADVGLADRIRLALLSDVDLADRLSHFRSLLNHVDGVRESFEPPSDLIESTLARIDQECPVASSCDTDGQTFRPTVTELTQVAEISPSGRGWIDSAALTLSLTVLCCLTIPAIVKARFESRRAQCAANLRETGQALFEFAMARADQRLPFVAESGPEAFSGVFVIRLNELGLLSSTNLLRCVSLNGVDRQLDRSIAVPTLKQLHEATGAQADYWKCKLGGDYAYNLGVVEDDRLVAPRNSGNSHFAILGDAPRIVSGTDQIVAHDGQGLNLLFDDGQVRFVSSRWIHADDAVGDHPFRNFLGVREAGLGSTDASLAPSQFPPRAH